MVEVKNAGNSFAALFDRIATGGALSEQAWFSETRHAAFDRFASLGFPTTKDEAWCFTSVARIAKASFVGPSGGSAPEGLVDEARLGVDEHLLVFVDGRYSPGDSSIGSLGGGVVVRSLADAMNDDAASVEPRLARHASYAEHAFVALNTALLEDGAFVQIPDGSVIAEPIHIVHLHAGGQEAVAAHPRNLVVVGANAQVTVVESYLGRTDGATLTNAVTEFVVGDGAVVNHYKIVDEGDRAFHTATMQLYQQRASHVTSHTVSLGGALVRNEINTVLDGEGCCSTLNGFTMISGEQHVDNHLVVDHAKPHCDSREFFKNVLNGKSRGVFSGRIIVREDAQKTDAKQSNQSLLLSDGAQVESKPQLEILADDVKCTHGATVGQVDEEAVFYLQSRGMSAAAARSLLVFAFAREALAGIKIEPLRRRLERAVFDRLPEGSLLEDAI